MYMVYWIEVENGAQAARARAFDSQDMAAALRFMERLRGRQRAGEALSFVTMASEHPDAIGHPGVGDPAPDYNWKKRRI
jgi:hypothetical protein